MAMVYSEASQQLFTKISKISFCKIPETRLLNTFLNDITTQVSFSYHLFTTSCTFTMATGSGNSLENKAEGALFTAKVSVNPIKWSITLKQFVGNLGG